MSKKTLAVLRFPTIESSIIFDENGRVVVADEDTKFTVHQMGELIGGVNVEKFWDTGVLSLSTALAYSYKTNDIDTTVIHAVYESKSETPEQREEEEIEVFQDVEYEGVLSSLEELFEEPFVTLW